MSRRADGAGALLRGLAWVGIFGLVALWVRSLATSAVGGAALPQSHSAGGGSMRESGEGTPADRHGDVAPGEEGPDGSDVVKGLRGYSIGLGLAVLLTAISFSLPGNSLVWGPAIPAALIVFAIAQMGVHLVFFLHVTTGPDNTNNVMALAFGLVIVILLIGGTLWIMSHLNANMAPMDQMMQMQR